MSITVEEALEKLRTPKVINLGRSYLVPFVELSCWLNAQSKTKIDYALLKGLMLQNFPLFNQKERFSVPIMLGKGCHYIFRQWGPRSQPFRVGIE